MSRAGARFSQVALKRALRGASDAGVPIDRAEIDPDGRIVLFFARGEAKDAGDEQCREDGVLDAGEAW